MRALSHNGHDERRDRNRNRDEARCHADGARWGDHELPAIPRRDELRSRLRQRGHDLRLEVRRRRYATTALDLAVDVLPELDIMSRVALTNARLRKLAVQPGVHDWRENPSVM